MLTRSAEFIVVARYQYVVVARNLNRQPASRQTAVLHIVSASSWLRSINVRRAEPRSMP